jgi:hypothetical protein
MNELDRLRDDAARVTKRGIGMPAAGMIYWLAMAWVGATYKPQSAALLFFIGTGLVFPIGYGLTRLAGGDLFAKGNPLTGLGGILNAVQAFYWPMAILLFYKDPMLVPFAFGTLFGSHFLPYGWFYRSRGYTFLGIAAPVITIVVQIAMPERVYTAVPVALAGMYLACVAMLAGENRKLEAVPAS